MQQLTTEKAIKWKKNVPNRNAGINNIQFPGDSKLIVWQSREREPTEYEFDISEGLIKAFSSGAETLDEVVQALNDIGILREDGEAFTAETFQKEIERLGY